MSNLQSRFDDSEGDNTRLNFIEGELVWTPQWICVHGNDIAVDDCGECQIEYERREAGRAE